MLLSRDWNLDIVQRAAETCVQESDRVHWLDQGTEHPHRIALSVHKDMVRQVKEKVKSEVDRAGYKAQFIISGSGDFQYMDILSIHGGKRKAMEYVRRIFGVTPSRVVAAGDSGNDILMLQGVHPYTDIPQTSCVSTGQLILRLNCKLKRSGPCLQLVSGVTMDDCMLGDALHAADVAFELM